MKKLLSVMAALLLAVFTATGVHAANPSQAGRTSFVGAENSNGAAISVTVTPTAQEAVPVAEDQPAVVAAFDVEGVPEGEKYTLTVANPEFVSGTTYQYIHYKSDTDPTVVDSGTVTANADHQLTLTLTGCSPVIIKAVGTSSNGAGSGAGAGSGTSAGSGASAGSNTSAGTGAAAGSGVAVPNTGVDAE